MTLLGFMVLLLRPKLLDLVARGHARLRARAGDRDRRRGVRESAGLVQVAALGQRHCEGSVPRVAGRGGVDRDHFVAGPDLRSVGRDRDRTQWAELGDRHPRPALDQRPEQQGCLFSRGRARRRAGENAQLALVGSDEVGEGQESGVPCAGRRRVEDDPHARGPREPRRGLHRLEGHLELEQQDRSAFDEVTSILDVFGAEAGVGARSQHDLVLAGGVDGDHGDPGEGVHVVEHGLVGDARGRQARPQHPPRGRRCRPCRPWPHGRRGERPPPPGWRPCLRERPRSRCR